MTTIYEFFQKFYSNLESMEQNLEWRPPIYDPERKPRFEDDVKSFAHGMVQHFRNPPQRFSLGAWTHYLLPNGALKSGSRNVLEIHEATQDAWDLSYGTAWVIDVANSAILGMAGGTAATVGALLFIPSILPGTTRNLGLQALRGERLDLGNAFGDVAFYDDAAGLYHFLEGVGAFHLPLTVGAGTLYEAATTQTSFEESLSHNFWGYYEFMGNRILGYDRNNTVAGDNGATVVGNLFALCTPFAAAELNPSFRKTEIALRKGKMDPILELRDIFSQEPSVEGFEKILKVVEEAPWELESIVLEYAKTHLENWPDEVRIYDPRDVGDITGLDPRPPFYRLVRILDLSNRNIGDVGAGRLGSASDLSGLTGLILQSNDIGPLGAQALAFSRLWLLESLFLASNHIGDMGLQDLAANTFRFELRHLDLRDNNIGPRGMLALTHAPHLSSLRSLLLSGNPIGEMGIQALLGVNRFSKLWHLFLADCNIGVAGAQALANAPHWRNLFHLDLGNNNLGDAGIQVLADSDLFRPVEHLNLRTNQIGDSGLQALVGSGCLGNLKYLDLMYNRIGSAGARVLANSEHLQNLEKLFLFGNPIGEMGFLELMESPFLSEEVKAQIRQQFYY